MDDKNIFDFWKLYFFFHALIFSFSHYEGLRFHAFVAGLLFNLASVGAGFFILEKSPDSPFWFLGMGMFLASYFAHLFWNSIDDFTKLRGDSSFSSLVGLISGSLATLSSHPWLAVFRDMLKPTALINFIKRKRSSQGDNLLPKPWSGQRGRQGRLITLLLVAFSLFPQSALANSGQMTSFLTISSWIVVVLILGLLVGVVFINHLLRKSKRIVMKSLDDNNIEIHKDRIRVIRNIHSFVRGGAEKGVLDQGRTINHKEFALYALTYRNEKQYNNEIESAQDNGMQFIYKPERKTYTPDSTWRIIYKRPFYKFRSAYWYFERAVNHFYFIKIIQPHIVHYHLPSAKRIFFGMLITRIFSSAKIVFTYHNYPHERRFNRFNIVFRILYFLSLYLSFRFLTDTFISFSEDERQAHIKWGVPERIIKVIPNSVQLELFEGELVESNSRLSHLKEKWSNNFVIGDVANLKSHKNIDILIEVAKNLREEFPNLRFLVSGEGVERVNLEGKIKEYGLDGVFELVGAIEHSNIPQVLDLMDLFVHASNREGFPNVVHESMAAGVPGIATQIGSIVEHAGDIWPLVEINNVTELTDKIRELIRDNDRRSEIAQLGLEHVKKYSDVINARRTEDMYREVLTDNGVKLMPPEGLTRTLQNLS